MNEDSWIGGAEPLYFKDGLGVLQLWYQSQGSESLWAVDVRDIEIIDTSSETGEEDDDFSFPNYDPYEDR